jgi:SAM-dependent methyltransferase
MAGTRKAKPAVSPPKDWDKAATDIHNRYGYLSHDYSVLGEIIGRIGAKSVLEIGCGSGRLIPVYLLHGMNPIWVQDISASALDICQRRFLHQKQIRYFKGNIQDLPLNTAVDLIVSTRVLQHITSDDDVKRILGFLADKAISFFVNEASALDSVSLMDPYIRGRDYSTIFTKLDFQLSDYGELEAERGVRQSWKLFERKGLPGRQCAEGRYNSSDREIAIASL